MKFYQLNIALSPSLNKAFPYVTGRTLAQKGYFDHEGKIYKEQYIDDAPIFDYFSLISINSEFPYDWIQLDVYEYSETNYPIAPGFFVSKKFKELLDNFLIDPPFKFYESRLMYQKEKYEYYIFQLCSKFYYNINFKESTWQSSKLARLNGRKDFDNQIMSFQEYNFGKPLIGPVGEKVFPKKAVLKKYCDFMNIISVFGYAISERLKDAIIEAGITGLEITPIDHIEFEFEEGVPA